MASITSAAKKAGVIVFLGALNWGLIGIFGYDLFSAVFGTGVALKICNVVVGLSALYMLYENYHK